MESLKAQVRVGAMLIVGALALPACGDAEEKAEDRDPVTDRKDAARSRDSGPKAGDAGKKDAGSERANSSRDAGRTPAASSDDESDDEDDSSDGAGEPDDQDVTGSMGADEEAVDASTGAKPEPKAPAGGAGEVITTDMGTKIYLDPSCPDMMPMIAGMAIDLVGCCLEGMCGLSTHKLMIPPAFAAMFPTACRGYEALAMFTPERPEDKACSSGE